MESAVQAQMPRKNIKIVGQLHNGMLDRVFVDGTFSEPFNISNKSNRAMFVNQISKVFSFLKYLTYHKLPEYEHTQQFSTPKDLSLKQTV